MRGWGGAKRVHLLNYYKAKSKKPHDFDAQRSLQISTSNVHVRRYVFRRPTRTLLAKWGHRTSGPRNARAEEAVLPQTWCGRRGCPRARQARALRAHLPRLRRRHRPLPQAQPAPAPHPPVRLRSSVIETCARSLQILAPALVDLELTLFNV